MCAIDRSHGDFCPAAAAAALLFLLLLLACMSFFAPGALVARALRPVAAPR
jgi:hypothetical protein